MTEQDQDPFTAREMTLDAHEGHAELYHHDNHTHPFQLFINDGGNHAALKLDREQADRLAIWLRCRLDTGK